MKVCPFCGEEIRAAALVCRYCRSSLAPGADPFGAAQPGAVGVPQQTVSGATEPAGAKAMAISGFVVVAIPLLYWLFNIVRGIPILFRYGLDPRIVINIATGGGYYTSYSRIVVAHLCVLASIAAALLLLVAKRKGASVWRTHPRIPFQMVAWVLAGLFLARIVQYRLGVW